MPTAAVSAGVSPTVSSGSARQSAGIMRWWNSPFLMRARSSIKAAARPISDPVPEVVGTLMTGGRPAVTTLAWAAWNSWKLATVSASIGWRCTVMKAIALPASRLLPPPNAITPSWPAAR